MNVPVLANFSGISFAWTFGEDAGQVLTCAQAGVTEVELGDPVRSRVFPCTDDAGVDGVEDYFPQLNRGWINFSASGADGGRYEAVAQYFQTGLFPTRADGGQTDIALQRTR